MIYISSADIISLVMISAFLIIVYKRAVHNWNFIEKIKQRFSESDKNTKIQNHIRYISRQPVDRQKVIFKDMSILTIAVLILFLIGMRYIFFEDVISGSMSPTFNKNDLVLMQNIYRTYNVGDIIMFERPDISLPVSHRIVSIGDDGIHTAGDATRTMDWWTLKNEDIKGKALIIQGRPIVIKGYGKYFTIEDKSQRFGPFDYQTYSLFLAVIKAYGYAIAIFSLLAYVTLTFKGKDRNKVNNKIKEKKWS
jgi:signal peptidase